MKIQVTKDTSRARIIHADQSFIFKLDNEHVCDICLHNIVKNVVFSSLIVRRGFDIEARLFISWNKNKIHSWLLSSSAYLTLIACGKVMLPLKSCLMGLMKVKMLSVVINSVIKHGNAFFDKNLTSFLWCYLFKSLTYF